MASHSLKLPMTTGSVSFDPDVLFQNWVNGQKTLPEQNDLRSSIIATFNLPTNDQFVYHAIASVNLDQVQEAINHGGEVGLHAWYFNEEGNTLSPPPSGDILAYTSIFASNSTPSKLLTGLAANAKKDTIRAKVASYLQAQRMVPPDLKTPRSKKHVNPYYDFWCWSCQNLEWAGPEKGTVNVKISHHILPIFMHHFGCVVPSYESLEAIRQLARTRTVLEIGSGNGYWTYMLRRLGVSVRAVDNLQSNYRTLWINDTILKDGEKYLKEEKGCADALLLLVYPIVSSGFTSKILDAYVGDTICVAGTQNRSGYTAFSDKTIIEHVAAKKADFKLTVQMPLPSFAGKDEALCVFQRLKN